MVTNQSRAAFCLTNPILDLASPCHSFNKLIKPDLKRSELLAGISQQKTILRQSALKRHLLIAFTNLFLSTFYPFVFQCRPYSYMFFRVGLLSDLFFQVASLNRCLLLEDRFSVLHSPSQWPFSAFFPLAVHLLVVMNKTNLQNLQQYDE